MKVQTIATIETAVSAIAAASMAAALGYAVASLLAGHYNLPIVPAMAVAAVAFTATRSALGRIDAPVGAPQANALSAYPSLTMSDFIGVGAPVGSFVVAAESGPADAVEPLLLDDVLAELSPDSRVVQLFGEQPTPGELLVRIDRHLEARANAPAPDESEAMFAALDQLKRSLG